MADPAGYRRAAPGTQPAYLHPAYQSTVKRSPSQKLIKLPHTLPEVTGPVFGQSSVKPGDADLTNRSASA